MNPYWNVNSIKHQNKLQFLSKKSDITVDRALRNIVSYLKNEIENSSRPHYLKEFITAGRIEGLIDIITR